MACEDARHQAIREQNFVSSDIGRITLHTAHLLPNLQSHTILTKEGRRCWAMWVNSMRATCLQFQLPLAWSDACRTSHSLRKIYVRCWNESKLFLILTTPLALWGGWNQLVSIWLSSKEMENHSSSTNRMRLNGIENRQIELRGRRTPAYLQSLQQVSWIR